MAYLEIRVKTSEETAKKVLKGWQFALFKTKLRSMYNLLKFRLNKYIVEQDKTHFVAREESEDESYIIKELRDWENFMYAQEKELTDGKYKEYRQFKNDRLIARVANYAKEKRNKAIQAALGFGDVMGFFLRIGIIIDYESDIKNGSNKRKRKV